MEVILEIKRQRGKAVVTVSDGSVIQVPLALLRERPLHEGEPIDLEAYDNWLLLKQYRPALDRAVAALAARAHSRREIEDKLLRSGFRPATVEMVMLKLEQNNLLDDADFARQWVEARAARKLGRQRIAMELRRKGVSADEAETALESLDGDEQLDNAVTLAEKAYARAKQGEDPRKTAQRIHAMLARRGFGWDIAKAAVAKAMAGEDDDMFDE